jgi:hypothetical protein
MKIGQIFYHPWVLGFEKELKQKTFGNYIIPEEAELTVEEKKLDVNLLFTKEYKSNIKSDFKENMKNIKEIVKEDYKLQENAHALEMKKKFLEKIKIFEKKLDRINLSNLEKEANVTYKKEEDIEEKLNIEDTNTNSKTNSSGARKNSNSSISSNNKKESNDNFEDKEDKLFTSDFNHLANKENKFSRTQYNYFHDELFKRPFEQNPRDKLFDEVIPKLEKKNSRRKKNQSSNDYSNSASYKFNNINGRDKSIVPFSRNRTFTLNDIQKDLDNLKKINDFFPDLKIDEKPKISEIEQSSEIFDNTINYNIKNDMILENIEDSEKLRYTTNFMTNHPQNNLTVSNMKFRSNNSIDTNNYLFKKKKVRNEINKT